MIDFSIFCVERFLLWQTHSRQDKPHRSHPYHQITETQLKNLGITNDAYDIVHLHGSIEVSPRLPSHYYHCCCRYQHHHRKPLIHLRRMSAANAIMITANEHHHYRILCRYPMAPLSWRAYLMGHFTRGFTSKTVPIPAPLGPSFCRRYGLWWP